MPATDPATFSPPRRAPQQEALAARVRSASNAAVEALHAAAADRRFVHEREWGQSVRDTLADIDEVADVLQGFATWVVGGRPHPQIQKVRATLGELARQANFDLRARLVGEWEHCTNLLEYAGRLEDLRRALSDYFEVDAKLTGSGPAS